MKRFLLLPVAGMLAASAIVTPMFAQGNYDDSGSRSSESSHKSEDSSRLKPSKKLPVDYACVAQAVVARDTAISTALQTVATAVQTRGQALSAAWTMSGATLRTAAVKAANTAFAGTWKTFIKARNDAWKQFRTAVKACRLPSNQITSPTNSSGNL
jgi:hypothetical protein